MSEGKSWIVIIDELIVFFFIGDGDEAGEMTKEEEDDKENLFLGDGE